MAQQVAADNERQKKKLAELERDLESARAAANAAQGMLQHFCFFILLKSIIQRLNEEPLRAIYHSAKIVCKNIANCELLRFEWIVSHSSSF